MMQEYDGKSRVDCLIRDFMNALDEQDMNNFDEEEPKLRLKYLVNALRPPCLPDAVRSELKRQANRRYRANVPEFVAWLKPQVVKFVKFEPALMSMTVFSGAEVEVRVCLTYLNLKKQKKQCGDRWTTHIYEDWTYKCNYKGPKDCIQEKGENHTTTRMSPCRSTDHTVFCCPDCDSTRA